MKKERRRGRHERGERMRSKAEIRGGEGAGGGVDGVVVAASTSRAPVAVHRERKARGEKKRRPKR
jgi:hypothetical protein